MKYILGTSSVQWSQVARVESTQLFIVKKDDGAVYTGTLNTATASQENIVQIEVVEAAGTTVAIERPRIVTMDVTSEKFFQRFNGSINIGSTYSKGNESRQYSLGSEINYPRERWAAGARYNSTVTANTGATASALNRLISMPSHAALESMFLQRVGSLLQSSEQSINAQIPLAEVWGAF